MSYGRPGTYQPKSSICVFDEMCKSEYWMLIGREKKLGKFRGSMRWKD